MNLLNVKKISIKCFLSILMLGASSLLWALPPNSSDYVKDVQISYNDDNATDAFAIIKTVTCFLTNTKPELKAGQGAYVAWVSKAACSDSNQTVTTSTSSADTAPRYAKGTVLSNFTSNGELSVKIWLRNTNFHSDTATWVEETIFVRVMVNSGVAVTPPLGTWSMDYCIVPNVNSTTCTKGYGHAEVSPAQIRVYQRNLWWDDATVETNVGTINYTVTNGEILAGRGIVNIDTSGPGLNCGPSCSREYYSRFAFQDNHYLAHVLLGTGSPKDICYDRRASNAISSAWQTWLYNNDSSVTSGDGAYGNHLKLNSGLSIEKTDGSRGWFGYWGMWFPEGVVRPSSGDTVTGNQSGVTKSYTYRKSIGKIYKNTISKSVLSGSGFDGVSFLVSLPENYVTTNGSGTQYPVTSQVQMSWNHSTERFTVESVNGDNSGVRSGKTMTITQLLTAAGVVVANQSSVYAWQNNSPVNYQLAIGDFNCVGGCSVKPRAASAAFAVTRFRNQVLPGTSDATSLASQNLICTGGCIGRAGTFVEANPWNSVTQSNPVTYSYNASTGNLSVSGGKTQAGVDISTGSISQPSSGYFNETRPLVLANDSATLSALSCSSGTQYCGWQSDQTASYYSFAIGPNVWDNTEFLQDSGTPVVFDQPLNLTYAVNQAGSPYDGKTAYIQYNGNGNLNIPGHCVNRANPSQLVDCSGDGTFYKTDFLVPPYAGTLNDISSPTSTQVSQATLAKQSNSSVTYLGKWLRRGTLYASNDVTGAINTSECRAMTAPGVGDLPLPSQSDFRNPADPSSSNFLGAWQEPSGDPSVTDGVLK